MYSLKGWKNAPDWTRTSMPIKAQALNLPCIPIPPQGHLKDIYYYTFTGSICQVF